MRGEETGNLVGYFGFGSLVNKHTLRTSYVDMLPATLNGWSRHWQARVEVFPEKIALLSIHKSAGTSIKGMLVLDRLENLPLVDEREKGYSRHVLDKSDIVVPGDVELPDELYVYIANEAEHVVDDGALLQSYLDAVLQGYLIEYGEDGVTHFVDTTRNFERPMIRDRDSPIYPRSVAISEAEEELFDAELLRAGVLAL